MAAGRAPGPPSKARRSAVPFTNRSFPCVPSRSASPPSGFHNGVARDPGSGDLFVTDWATGDLLAPMSGFGANGVKVHDGAVWGVQPGPGHAGLSTSDGLANPTSVAVRGDTLYVADSAYFGGSPNLLRTRLE